MALALKLNDFNTLLSTICTFVVVSLLLFAFSRFLKLPLKADDTEGPEIVDWAIMPDSINSDDAEVDITFYVRIKAEEGLESFTTSSFVAQKAEGKSISFLLQLMTEIDEEGGGCIVPEGFNFNVEELVGCGDEFDGIYSASMKLPQYSIDGDWLSSGDIKDNEGNILRFEDLEEKDRPYFTNNATNFDITPPVIKSLVVDKTSFDTSEGPATITITMELEDERSGIDTGEYKSIFHFHPVLEWGSSLHSNGLKPVEGEEGFFTTEIIIPKGSKPGFWTFASGTISDLAGNEAYIDFSKYIEEKYFANTAISSEVTIEGMWWLEGQSLSSVSYEGATKVTSSWPSVVIIFQEGTIVTKQGGGNFGIHRMVSESYITEKYKTLAELLTEANEKLEADIKKCHESEGCVAEELTGSDLVGNPINIGKVGLPGLGLSFSKPATIILAVDEKYLGQTLEVQTFDGTKWVKIGSCLVKTFDPLDPSAGADPEGEYKSVSYPGCSFTTDHASFFSANVLGAETETEKEVEKEAEKLPGVPNTGLGGTSSILYKYIGWIR